MRQAVCLAGAAMPAALLVILAAASARAQEDEVGIADNSFLIEEAYNQEPGIVQHIFNWVPSWDYGGGHTSTFDIVFTQEWPLGSQKNQFSYTVPMTYQYERLDGELPKEAQGFGDIFLNYRRQVWDGKDGGLAFAPRLSVLLPTGEEESGLGSGQVGYQINLPLSKESERGALHFNAGTTIIPGVQSGTEIIPFEAHDINGYNLGLSAIRFLGPSFHLMLETLLLWDEEPIPVPGAGEESQFLLLLSPGFRWAPYTEGDTQWVVGVGLPIGLTEPTPDISLFLYMSFEHRFAKSR